MFKAVVNMFAHGDIIDNYVFGKQKYYGLYLRIRRTLPEMFAKDGRKFRFIGDVNELFQYEDMFINDEQQDVNKARPVIKEQTDEEIMERIDNIFSSLKKLSNAAANMKIRSMIVSGSPGTGKTFEVLTALETKAKQERQFYYQVIKGSISPVALFIELYRARDGVLVLDDTDEAFTDNESLQLLKAATESSKTRLISYRKLSMALESEGIPSSFEFNGCVIILTNTNLEKARAAKQGHYDAIISRAHYINAVLETEREKVLRIMHVIENSYILNKFLEKSAHKDVIEFIREHSGQARELSIRTVVKLAELRAAFSEDWLVLAKGTLLK